MNKISILIAVWLLTGCQTTPVGQISESTAATCERSPAGSAGSCKLVVAPHDQILPSSTELHAVFDSLSNYKAKAWDIIATVEKGYTANSGDNANPVIFGELLIERRAVGESTAKILTELGYREEHGYLMPPRNIARVISNLYSKLQASALAGKIPPNEIIWPAFRFSRYVNGKSEKVYVRLGIDPLPPQNEDWGFDLHQGQLESKEFNDLILAGKMPMTASMFFHDIDHVIDFIERPEYMAAYRKYLTAQNKVLHETSGDKDETERKFGQAAKALKADDVLNEFIYLPSTKNLAKINKILLPAPEGTLATHEMLTSEYDKLATAELLKKASDFKAKSELMFSRFGGGARDTYLERNQKIHITLKTLDELIQGEATYSGLAQHQPLTRLWGYLQNEAPLMFLRLNLLTDYAQNPHAMPVEVQKLMADRAKQRAVEPQEFGRQLLALELAEIDQRVRSALFYKMSPEQILTDLALLGKPDGWKDYMHSRTFHYYSTYLKGSFQRASFVDVLPVGANAEQTSQ